MRRLQTVCHRPAGLVRGLVAMLTAVLCLSVAASAQAQVPAFSIAPADRTPYFVLHLTPGSTVTRRVRVTNVGNRSGEVRLSGVDATTGATTGAVYLAQGAARHAVGGWLAVSSSSLTLAAHRSALVPFTITVPAGAVPGEHLGGLVAAPVVPATTGVSHRGASAFRVVVNEISVVGVEVRLPGAAVHRMTIGDVTASGRPGYQTLLVDLANRGNALEKGTGVIDVRGAGGSSAFAEHFTLDTFVAGTNIRYPVYLRHRLTAGRYTVSVRLRYAGGLVASRTTRFTVGTRQLRQTYGTKVPASLATNNLRSSSTPPVWLLALGAVTLLALGIGGSTLYFRARLRATGTGPRD